jgi:hypothetical protein
MSTAKDARNAGSQHAMTVDQSPDPDPTHVEDPQDRGRESIGTG